MQLTRPGSRQLTAYVHRLKSCGSHKIGSAAPLRRTLTATDGGFNPPPHHELTVRGKAGLTLIQMPLAVSPGHSGTVCWGLEWLGIIQHRYAIQSSTSKH
ncbi:hypothetical protein DPEC_G00278140 [Dallia pectoralis]|uniref:Uncharacterized protein n=1 Tax=Dallia pectoralis TaxID=75939 RepID=A0ACC2FMF3_DALPE|nr:hypothetical protein DPEC_G00278140 [Dallia pectoralis]